MAYTRIKICKYAGCTGYATEGAYCSIHQRKPESRGTTSKFSQFYHRKAWTRAKTNFLLNHIFCDKCKTSLATLVHHEWGFNDWNTFLNQNHWVAWCQSCHSSYHMGMTNEQLYNLHKEEWEKER